MSKLMTSVTALVLLASSVTAGGLSNEIVDTPPVAAPADADVAMGGLGNVLPWLIGAGVIAALLLAAQDEESSGTN